MWRYWTRLTDSPASETDVMRAEVASGATHPLAAKIAMARSITESMWGWEKARNAQENWSTQYQKGGVSDDTERVTLTSEAVAFGNDTIAMVKFLVASGMAASMNEARRKRAENAVKIDGWTASASDVRFPVSDLPVTLTVKLGKKTKLVTIQ